MRVRRVFCQDTNRGLRIDWKTRKPISVGTVKDTDDSLRSSTLMGQGIERVPQGSDVAVAGAFVVAWHVA